jgi:cytochrome c-type biogenesis protein CcmF
MRAHGEAFVQALFHLVSKNKRRYGGYIVHFGVVLMFVGFAGAAFNQETSGEMAEGDKVTLGKYTFLCNGIKELDTPNYYFLEAALSVTTQNGKHVTNLYPEKRVYKASEQASSEVAMRSNLKEDIYAVFAGMSEESNKAVIQFYLNPLVTWLWIGGIVMLAGTLVCIFPDLKRVRVERGRRALERLLTNADRK